MKTPEEKLCSRWWRIRHSSWILFSILSAGLFTSVGFIIIAAKSKKRHLIIASVGWGIFTIALLTSFSMIDSGTKENPVKSLASDVQSAVVFFGWIGGMVHSFVVNRSWLKWRAGHVKGMPWYGQVNPANAASHQGGDPLGDALHGYGQQPMQQIPAQLSYAPAPSHAAGQSSLSRSQPSGGATVVPSFPQGTPLQPTAPAASDWRQQQPATNELGPTVDLNTASSEEIQYGLGLASEVAAAVVSRRTAMGGFSSPDQLMQLGLVQPHVFMGLRDRLTTSTPAVHVSPPPSSGGRRTLDLS